MTSDRKRLAGRQNAARSTGATSPEGRARSRMNALKHGLSARNLIVNEGDKKQYASLRSAIMKQLGPSTALQQITAEDVAYCSWRRIPAMQLDVKSVAAQLVEQECPVTDIPAEPTAPSRPYLTSRTDLRKAQSFLLQVRQDVENTGGLHLEELKSALTAVFGLEFYQALSDWAPQNVSVIQLAHDLTRHSAAFNLLLPEKLVNGDRIVVDPNQG